MIAMRIVANEAEWPHVPALSDEAYSDVMAALVAYQHNTGHVWGTLKARERGDPSVRIASEPGYAKGLWCFPYVESFYGLWSGAKWRCAEP
jgi:hypothetical protein